MQSISTSMPEDKGRVLPTLYINNLELSEIEQKKLNEEFFIVCKVRMEGKEIYTVNEGETEERKYLEGRLKMLGISSVPSDYIGMIEKLKQDDFSKEKVAFLNKANRR